MEELFTIYDREHRVLGEALRDAAHREGLWHEVIHCWMVCRMGDTDWVYFQQRALSKADFPGYYDIASTGHVDAGERHLDAAVREVYEETGVRMEKSDPVYLGMVREEIHQGEFFDREFAHVYAYRLTLPAFAPGDEVERMVAVSAEELVRAERTRGPVHAVDLSGEPLLLKQEEFCSHPGEFSSLVLPWLREGQTAERK